MRSGFLGEVSFGNSVLGSCGVGLFVPDFDWKVSFGDRSAVGQDVSRGHRTSRGSIAGVRRLWEMLIFGDRGEWGGLARVRVRVRETVLVCLKCQWLKFGTKFASTCFHFASTLLPLCFHLGHRDALGQEVTWEHRVSRCWAAGVRRSCEMLILGDWGVWGGLARVRFASDCSDCSD